MSYHYHQKLMQMDDISLLHRKLFSINLWGLTSITDAGIESLLLRCTKLTTLSLAKTQIRDDSLLSIMSFVPTIKRLNLSSCTGINMLFRNYNLILSNLRHLLMLIRSFRRCVTSSWKVRNAVGNTLTGILQYR